MERMPSRKAGDSVLVETILMWSLDVIGVIVLALAVGIAGGSGVLLAISLISAVEKHRNKPYPPYSSETFGEAVKRLELRRRHETDDAWK
jgi:hypothetical protein